MRDARKLGGPAPGVVHNNYLREACRANPKEVRRKCGASERLDRQVIGKAPRAKLIRFVFRFYFRSAKSISLFDQPFHQPIRPAYSTRPFGQPMRSAYSTSPFGQPMRPAYSTSPFGQPNRPISGLAGGHVAAAAGCDAGCSGAALRRGYGGARPFPFPTSYHIASIDTHDRSIDIHDRSIDTRSVLTIDHGCRWPFGEPVRDILRESLPRAYREPAGSLIRSLSRALSGFLSGACQEPYQEPYQELVKSHARSPIRSLSRALSGVLSGICQEPYQEPYQEPVKSPVRSLVRSLSTLFAQRQRCEASWLYLCAPVCFGQNGRLRQQLGVCAGRGW